MRSPFLFSVLLALIFTGCATSKKSRLALTSGAFVVGAGIGQATAPKDERKELHAMYWGGLLGLTAAIVGQFVYDEEKELETARLENAKLKADLELIQNSNKVLLKEGKGYFKSSTGEEYFQSGKAKWRIYQIDQWVKDGPHKLFHQDKMVELVPVPE